jgi:hypothetical protein
VPYWFIQVYFVVFGLISTCIGVALLTDFRGLGKEWEDGLNRNSEYVGKLLHLPWPQNPYEGRAWRPFVGVFATLLGLAMLGAVLSGAMR